MGLSGAVCVDAQFAFKVPSDVEVDVGALVKRLSVAWHAVDTTGTDQA